MQDVLERTVGQKYATKPDQMALIPKVVSALDESFIEDATDFSRATDCDLDRVFKTACGDLGPGMLNFVLKYFGTPGHPHKPQPAAGLGLALDAGITTADTAAGLKTPASEDAAKAPPTRAPTILTRCAQRAA